MELINNYFQSAATVSFPEESYSTYLNQ